MTQQRIFRRKTTIVAAAGVVAGLSLVTSGALVRADRDDRGRDLRDAIDGGRAKNVIPFLLNSATTNAVPLTSLICAMGGLLAIPVTCEW